MTRPDKIIIHSAAQGLTQHPLSAAYPKMSDDEFMALKDSIEVNGVLNPITLFEGQVIDGWHRYVAATELVMACPAIEFDSSWMDPIDFVKAQNENRRHMTASQRAMAITAIYRWHQVGKPKSAPSADLKTTAEMAVEAKTGTRTIEQAKAVHAHAVEEVKESVKAGVITVKTAAAIVKLPKPEQAAAIHKPLPKAQPADVQDVAYRDIPAEPDCGPDADELAAQELTEQADRIAMQKFLDSDDKLAELFKEVQRLNAEVSALKMARDGFMRKANEAIALVNKRDREIKHLREEQRAALQQEAA